MPFNLGAMMSGIGGAKPSQPGQSSGMGKSGGLLSKFKHKQQQPPGNMQNKNMFASTPDVFAGNFGSGQDMGGYNPGIQGGMVSPYAAGGATPFSGMQGSIQNMFAPKKPNFFSSYFGR